MRAFLAIGAALTVSGCVGVKFVSELPNKTATSQYVFKSALETLCVGEAYEGKLITTDAADDGFRSQRIVMGPSVCMYGIVQIPLAVGDDRSRIWQIYPTEDGFRLKHDHSHKDGTKDALTQYGGDSFGEGTGIRQIFPVDAETRALFTREGIEVSNQNTWGIEIRPSQEFAYEMWRPERHFKLVFDLTKPVAPPPAPWAVEPVSDEH